MKSFPSVSSFYRCLDIWVKLWNCFTSYFFFSIIKLFNSVNVVKTNKSLLVKEIAKKAGHGGAYL